MTPIQWALSGDTGISSQTICAVMTDCEPDWAGTPADASDFGRCYRLLQHFPEWRARMPEVAAKYPEWTAIVREWDELTALYEREKAAKFKTGAFYERISALRDEGRLAAGWQQHAPGCWSKDDTMEVSLGRAGSRGADA